MSRVFVPCITLVRLHLHRGVPDVFCSIYISYSLEYTDALASEGGWILNKFICKMRRVVVCVTVILRRIYNNLKLISICLLPAGKCSHAAY